MAVSAARNAKSMSRLRRRLAASAMALAPAVAYGLAAHDAAAAGTLVIDSRGASYVEHFAGASRRSGPTVDGPVTLNLSVLDGLGGPRQNLLRLRPPRRQLAAAPNLRPPRRLTSAATPRIRLKPPTTQVARIKLRPPRRSQAKPTRMNRPMATARAQFAYAPPLPRRRPAEMEPMAGPAVQVAAAPLKPNTWPQSAARPMLKAPKPRALSAPPPLQPSRPANRPIELATRPPVAPPAPTPRPTETQLTTARPASLRAGPPNKPVMAAPTLAERQPAPKDLPPAPVSESAKPPMTARMTATEEQRKRFPIIFDREKPPGMAEPGWVSAAPAAADRAAAPDANLPAIASLAPPPTAEPQAVRPSAPPSRAPLQLKATRSAAEPPRTTAAPPPAAPKIVLKASPPASGALPEPASAPAPRPVITSEVTQPGSAVLAPPPPPARAPAIAARPESAKALPEPAEERPDLPARKRLQIPTGLARVQAPGAATGAGAAAPRRLTPPEPTAAATGQAPAFAQLALPAPIAPSAPLASAASKVEETRLEDLFASAPAAAPAPLSAPEPAPVPRPPKAMVAPTAAGGPDAEIAFGASSRALPPGAERQLARIADRLKADPSLRASLSADASAREARRARDLALDRALAVQRYLISRGVFSGAIRVEPVSAAGDRDAVAVRLVEAA